MKDFTVLYIGTAAMLFLALCLIFFVVWATMAMNKQRQLSEQRDKHWGKRIDGMENIIKNEFQELLKALKL